MILRIASKMLDLERHPFRVKLAWLWQVKDSMPLRLLVRLRTTSLAKTTPTTQETSFMLETYVIDFVFLACNSKILIILTHIISSSYLTKSYNYLELLPHTGDVTPLLTCLELCCHSCRTKPDGKISKISSDLLETSFAQISTLAQTAGPRGLEPSSLRLPRMHSKLLVSLQSFHF